MILLSKCGHSNQWVHTNTNDYLEVLQYFYLLFYTFSTVHYVYMPCCVIYCAFSFTCVHVRERKSDHSRMGGGCQAD